MNLDDVLARKVAASGVPVELLLAADASAAQAIRDGGQTLLPPYWSREQAAEIFFQAWYYVTSIDRLAERDVWIRYLRRLGYVENTEHRDPPRVRRLYRGAPTDARHGLSWTPTRAHAAEWARRSPWRPAANPGRVWSVWVPSSAFLAKIYVPDDLLAEAAADPDVTEVEYLIDTTGLELTWERP